MSRLRTSIFLIGGVVAVALAAGLSLFFGSTPIPPDQVPVSYTHLIKCSGYRIGPFEVESALVEHPAVVAVSYTHLSPTAGREAMTSPPSCRSG